MVIVRESMEEYIEQQLPIDIALDKEKDHIYSGICIKSSHYVFIIMTFNEELGEFDGFNVFRDKDVVFYRLWDEEDRSELKNDNFEQLLSILDLSKMNTMYSALKEASQYGLIAFFTDLHDDEYYVGKLESIDRKNATFRLVSTEGEWLTRKRLPIKDISYFGFASSYEKELLNLNPEEPDPAG